VSVFRDILAFFDTIGIFDVVLPFILVFTVVFAILEKTRIFGTEKMLGPTQEQMGSALPKKNLNAMVAFVMAFLVVASTQLVAIVNQALANVVILLLVSVCFLLLIGSFYKETEEVFLEGTWRMVFMVIMFVGVVLIFLNAIRMEDGTSWLEFLYNTVATGLDSVVVGSLILIGIVIFFIWLITKDKHVPAAKKD
jgi:hypothetical protein